MEESSFPASDTFKRGFLGHGPHRAAVLGLLRRNKVLEADRQNWLSTSCWVTSGRLPKQLISEVELLTLTWQCSYEDSVTSSL
jgi:hypothetical protein